MRRIDIQRLDTDRLITLYDQYYQARYLLEDHLKEHHAGTEKGWAWGVIIDGLSHQQTVVGVELHRRKVAPSYESAVKDQEQDSLPF